MASNTFRFLDLPEYEESVILDKAASTRQYIEYMLDRTGQMFEYEGLPDTIPAYILEQYLQTYGVVAFSETKTVYPQNRLGDVTEGLFVFRGNLGARQDIYYRPSEFILANPVIPEGKNLKIGTECEIIKNDTRAIGLMPMFTRYAQQMVENDISIRSAQINSRQRVVIVCKTDAQKEAAIRYLNQLEAGELGVLVGEQFLEGVEVIGAGTANPNSIIQLIELQQYLKASWFNEIGLNTSFNMKREYLSAEEIAANTDVLLPLIDDMFECRQRGIERVNAMYGLNITVKKSSSWDNKARESESELEIMENQADGGEGDEDSKASGQDDT